MNELKIEYFRRQNGVCPYLDFYKEVDSKMKSKIDRELVLLKEYGIDFKHVHIKYFRQGVYKLRVNQGNLTSRVFFIIENNIIYLLHGFIKVTQKTPEGEKVRIIKYKNELLKQIKENH